MRYIQMHACSDDRIVAGARQASAAADAEGNWAPADIDVMTRGVQETDAVIVDSKAYWFNLGYTVQCERYDVRATDYYTGEGRADDHNRLRQLIRAWVDQNAGDMQYARLIGELGRVVDMPPRRRASVADPHLRAVESERWAAVLRPVQADRHAAQGTSHCINVIPYVCVPVFLPRTLEAASGDGAHREHRRLIRQQCAVWCRMNENKNGRRPARSTQSLEGGARILPLQLTNCAFATSTKAHHDEQAGPATDEQMQIVVDRQMKRLAKYMSRGFPYAY